jgi:DNA-directed RNA polymerase specialized sigma24 family protein
MKERDLILKEVAGKVSDTPPYVTAVNWFNKTPERKAMFIHTVHSLSTAAQARAQMLGPDVRKEVRALRLQGLLQKEIAQATGLCAMTVAKLLRQS